MDFLSKSLRFESKFDLFVLGASQNCNRFECNYTHHGRTSGALLDDDPVV